MITAYFRRNDKVKTETDKMKAHEGKKKKEGDLTQGKVVSYNRPKMK